MSVQEVARWAVVCDGCGAQLSLAFASKHDAEQVTLPPRTGGDWCVDCWEARRD